MRLALLLCLTWASVSAIEINFYYKDFISKSSAARCDCEVGVCDEAVVAQTMAPSEAPTALQTTLALTTADPATTSGAPTMQGTTLSTTTALEPATTTEGATTVAAGTSAPGTTVSVDATTIPMGPTSAPPNRTITSGGHNGVRVSLASLAALLVLFMPL